MRAFLMTGLLLSAALLAGCAGDSRSDVSGVSTSTQTNVGNTTVSGSVSAGPGGAAGAGNVTSDAGNASASTAWSHDNRTGTVEGNGAFVNVPFTKEEEFTVRNGTVTLHLNLTVQGDEVSLSLRAPGCADDACATTVDTQSGSASLQLDDPAMGDYVAVIQLEGVGPVKSDYTLGIAARAPAGASA